MDLKIYKQLWAPLATLLCCLAIILSSDYFIFSNLKDDIREAKSDLHKDINKLNNDIREMRASNRSIVELLIEKDLDKIRRDLYQNKKHHQIKSRPYAIR